MVEEEEEGYDVSYDGYTITNTSRYGALSIEKNVTGDGAEKDRYFTFTVVLKDADGNTLTGEYEYTMFWKKKQTAIEQAFCSKKDLR